MNRYLIHTLIMLPWLFVSTGASAFDVDGFRSGMTREQLSAEAKNRGLEAKENQYGFLIGKFADYQIDGSFAFCGEGMVAYTHSIDVNVDYIPNLQNLLKKYGQPRSVSTTQYPVSFSGGGSGYVSQMEMIWYARNDRITLSFLPENRDGKGQLRSAQGASIAYFSKNHCAKEF